MLSFESFYHFLQEKTSSNRFCIAFSGGLDSAVLLHLFNALSRIDSNINLRAIHINHGLSPNANHWEKQCQEICHQYQIPLHIKQLKLSKKPKMSLEDLARRARYDVFRQYLSQGETLVTAHHQDDQAETLLLQLFRGAGPKGLASMPGYVSFGQGFLIRPLLNFQKLALQQYAEKEGLQWIEDESNGNINFDRNFLRHEILPLLKQRWPNIADNLARSAYHCANADKYIAQQVVHIFEDLFNSENLALHIPSLLNHSIETQNYVIRYWLQRLDFPLPSTKKLGILHDEILKSRHDGNPLLRWKQVEIRRYNNYLYAMSPLSAHNTTLVIRWQMTDDLILPNNLGVIKLDELINSGINLDIPEPITVRFRQGGERCRLKNRTHTHSLKKLFQDWKIPPWNRDRIPLLYKGDELKAIVGYAVCE